MPFPKSIYVGNRKYSQVVIASPYPFGYSLYRVKRWDEYPMAQDGYSAYLRGNVGQFQVVSPYIFNAENVWCGTLSSNTNFSTMRRADVFKLANHQLLDSGYAWGLSESKIISLLNVPLKDGYTLKQKMGYLIWGTNLWGAQMKSRGDWWDWLKKPDGSYDLDENGNKKEVTVDMIAIVHGGQKVLMSEETKVYQGILMRKMLTFHRADFGKHYNTHPYLMQRVTVASTPNNVYGEYPKGHVYCPVALSSPDFDFTGKFLPDSHWLPEKYIIKL